MSVVLWSSGSCGGKGALHQVIGVFPAGRGRDAGEPGVDGGVIRAVEGEGLLVEEITAAGEIGRGEAVAHQPVALRQFALEDLKRGLEPACEESR
jgi:hypothetical protein